MSGREFLKSSKSCISGNKNFIFQTIILSYYIPGIVLGTRVQSKLDTQRCPPLWSLKFWQEEPDNAVDLENSCSKLAGDKCNGQREESRASKGDPSCLGQRG